MIKHLNKDRVTAKSKVRGEDIPPRLLGYHPYSMIERNVVRNELMNELETRGVEFERQGFGVKKGVKLLKPTEKIRYEKAAEQELESRKQPFEGLSLKEKLERLKAYLVKEEEYCSSEWDVDIEKYFKKMGTYNEDSLVE